MAKIKLATQRLSPSAPGGLLSPDHINPSAGFVSGQAGKISARVAAPSINVNAANEKFTPLRPNDIVVDNSLNAAAKMADVWVDSAFKYQQRQDKADADAVVLAYNDMLIKEETGYTDEDGNWVDGYLYTQKREATNKFDPHRGKIDGEMQNMLSSVPENVRQHAVIRMTNARNRALGRAAEHNVRQFQAVEAENLYLENRQILQNIAAHGPAPFEDGTINEHLVKYEDPAQRDEAAKYLSRYAIYQAYNKTLRETDNPMLAVQAAESIFESAKPHLQEVSKNELDHYLLGKRQTATQQHKKTQEKELRETQKEYDRSMPSTLHDSAKAANYDAYFEDLQNYRELYGGADENTKEGNPIQSQKVVEVSNKMFRDEALTSGLVTIQQKHDAAISLFNEVMDDGGADQYRDDEYSQIRTFVMSDLRQELVKKQKSIDTIASGRLAESVSAAERNGQLMKYVPPPEGMTEENAEKWDAAQQKHADEFSNGVDITKMGIREDTAIYYEAMQLDGPLSQEDLDDAYDMVVSGDISMIDYARIVATNSELTRPGYKTPPYKATAEYKSADTMIKTAGKMDIFNGGADEPEKGTPEHLQWEFNKNNRIAQAKLALERAARAAAIDKRPFDAMQWWNDYQVNVINEGRKTSKSFWSFLPLVD